ncbi:Fic family protein [Actinomyces slackii]|uniref:Fido domain-containing protein n=1 Tax=Actinomyces slackii TaxID=52774 RepID=A0A448KB14_9ACTO|nr:Fic family protein [Actinomyces slackii]VEG74116.1 Uncharacterised protein [Actinomyces slackii]
MSSSSVGSSVGIGSAPGPSAGQARQGRGAAGGSSGSQHAASPALAALTALAGHERVRQAEEAVRQASAELRWHNALRRRWREARAETSIREAVASAGVEGAVLPASVLREHVASASLEEAVTGDPGLDAAAGRWRAGVRVTGWMPDLVGRGRPPLPTPRGLLTSVHRDVAGPLAAGGAISVEEVAIPREGAGVRERLRGLEELIALPGAPALVRAAVVHGEMVAARPFTAGNEAVGRILVRHLITVDGLEPTGTAVTEFYASRDPGAYGEAAHAYASGSAQGVVAWVLWQAEAILVGIEEATALCRAIQAGTWRSG